MTELERVRYVTSNYYFLQGLKWAPWGVWFLLGAGWWRWYEVWQPVSGLLGIGVVLVLNWFVGAYYSRTFGRVDSAPAHESLKFVAVVLVAAVFIAGYLDGTLRPSVSIFVLAIAAAMLIYFRATVGLRAHRVAAVAVIFASSFLPLSDMVSYEEFHGTIFPVTLGLLIIVVGVIDHFLLVRTLEPLPE